MNLETEVLKTNEFLRRRKLRLQQVREQSKDIAKKIRQRTKVEKLRQVVDIDTKKQKEYLDKQEKLVKQLEVLYVRGLGNVGVGHQSAADLVHQDEVVKPDLSKVRGKEATVELRRIRQQKLDEQKRLLDRKLQAREAANELSREKSTVVANKLTSKSRKVSEDNQKATESSEPIKETTKEVDKNKDEPELKTSDMATQWDVDTMPNEWEPAVPSLALPKDDKDTMPEYETGNLESKSDKRLDLFALSKEMPSSLRGKHNEGIERNPVTMRPSLTLVSEYLQSRKLRLRETALNVSKPSNDIHTLKHTIQRTRISKPDEVSGKIRSNINKSNRDTLNRKASVTIYNHSTRDKRDMPCGDGNLVVRDLRSEEDAYSHALRETSGDNNQKDKESQKKIQDMRTKVAVAKQTVEKEYKETMNFLKNMPKSNGKVIKTAYMDERRQKMQREHKQRKMQNEFLKIERECTRPITHLDNSRFKSKSPLRRYQDDLENRDFEYSWMPVPEGDGNLVIHTIPNTNKEGKNNVKFSQVDSYHEYRSRHKHTPPTKDKTSQNQSNTKMRETVAIDKNTSDSTDTSSSDTSSVENLRLEKKEPRKNNPKDDTSLSDAERIIIYKILDSKKDKKCKKQTQLLNNIVKSLSSIENASKPNEADENRDRSGKTRDIHSENTVSLEQINEGIYKVIDQQGDNINAFNIINDQPGPSKVVTAPAKVQCQQCHRKHPDQVQKNTVFQWQSGDELPRANNTCKCGNTSEENPNKTPRNVNLTPGNSMSSFKTAANDRISNGRPDDGGFIKLLDEAGHEAGKFFIGASGILSDNAYEVVIQLRKKDDFKKDTEDNKGQTKHSTCIDAVKITETNEKLDEKVNKQYKNAETNHNNQQSEELNEVLAPGDVSEKSAKLSSNTNQSIQNIEKGVNTKFNEITCNKDNSETSIESSDNICLLKRYDNKQNMVDKCVYTSFLDNDKTSKSDPISRPLTTTFTQTSSPRPKYQHMSSSTSTAYMSPPEMILPRSIRRVSGKPESDFERMTDEHEFCEECSYCDCKKCQKASPVKDKIHISKQILTPPNSLSSYRKTHRCKNNHDIQSHNKISNICKSKCSKCASRKQIKGCTVKNNVRNRTTETHSHRSVPKLNTRCAANVPIKTYNKSMRRRQDRLKTNLNPLVKKYVDKLLILSKESFKALELADQDCSSITTPGSSIINVPFNIDEEKTSLRKISLEQIKNALEQKIANKIVDTKLIFSRNSATRTGRKTRTCRKRSVHKVKSFNVSKNLLKKHKLPESKSKRMLSLTSTDDTVKIFPKVPTPRGVTNQTKTRSKSSPTPRMRQTHDHSESSTRNTTTTEQATDKLTCKTKIIPQNYKSDKTINKYNKHLNQSEKTFASSDSENIKFSRVYKDSREVPLTMSTQTNENNENVNFMKLAEDKLNNMEKIADLTEKCTKRLSNLARVLDEVRKSKSLAYSHISASDSTGSQSDNKSDKAVESTSVEAETDIALQTSDTKPATTEKEVITESYISFLTDIPKPATFKIPEAKSTPLTNYPQHSDMTGDLKISNLSDHVKRLKPPPALTRMNLKHEDKVVPHELSTVIEVDSPMSVKHKTLSSRNDSKECNNTKQSPKGKDIEQIVTPKPKETRVNPDLLQSNIGPNKHSTRQPSIDLNDDSKFQMIDLKQFNEIMLEPFISIQDYAKKFNVEAPEEGSNVEDLRDEAITDDFSSLHSDGSLPDVIAELLKRNLITEPFKFDTVSNVNSATVSSESTLSTLALSKIRKEKKKPSVTFQNKENIGETSDVLSISSNPDLENAFKMLGMGWASSTLRKTKERLALSSSSNTSSSSTSQYKLKSFNQDIPVIVTDSVSSVLNQSQKRFQGKNVTESTAKHVQQQILMNTMTVKEFLTNELAKKITFNNKSAMNETEEEFVSLFETKMPEEMRLASETQRGEVSVDSTRSGANRARTSTPVQIYKSTTYHSSSSSNISNGLFSNADDLSSVKMTSNSIKNHSTSEKDDLTIPNFSLRMKKASDCSKSD